MMQLGEITDLCTVVALQGIHAGGDAACELENEKFHIKTRFPAQEYTYMVNFENLQLPISAVDYRKNRTPVPECVFTFP